MIGSRKTKLVFGKGRLYFEPFATGEDSASGLGEIYIGNTPGFAIQLDQSLVERWDSTGDQRVLREPEILSESHTGRFTTDDITSDNLALWYGQQAATKEAHSPWNGFPNYITVLSPGRFHQVGAGYIEDAGGSIFSRNPYPFPSGITGLRSLTIRDAETLEIIPSGDGTPYTIDLAAGRIHISNEVSSRRVRLTFTVNGSITDKLSPSSVKLHGSLRYLSNNPNPGAAQVNFFYPWVRLSATSTFDLKRPNEFLELNYEFTAYKKDGAEFVYLETAATSGLTPDEWAILEEGLSLSEFPPLDNELDRIINVIMPSRGYPTR